MKKQSDSEKEVIKKKSLNNRSHPKKKPSSNNQTYQEPRALVVKYFKQIKSPNYQNFKALGLNRTKSSKEKSNITATVVDDFSIFTDPEDVLSNISQLTHICLHESVESINIDQKFMTSHDLTSEILLAQLIVSVKAVKNKNSENLNIKGMYPHNKDFAKLIHSIGIVKQINANADNISTSNPDMTKVFRASCTLKEDINLHTSDKKSQKVEKFITYMDDCLAKLDRQLTPKASNQLTGIIGEMLGNAEDHAGIDERHWQFYSFMDQNSRNEVYQQISIFNFGQSIAQSFLNKKDNKTVFERLEFYLKLHANAYDEETLVTIMALQENVSSLIDKSPTRGQGFTDLLNFFADLCSECTQNDKPKFQMSIVSGHTSIYLDGTYLPSKDNETGRHLLFFNQNNDFMQPPDKNYVKKMEEVYFPGAIITLKFRLDSTQPQEAHDE